MQVTESIDAARPKYESPELAEVGSVRDLTLGQGWRGNDDTFVFSIGRHTISISYGELS
jgi:hypothetical protein